VKTAKTNLDKILADINKLNNAKNIEKAKILVDSIKLLGEYADMTSRQKREYHTLYAQLQGLVGPKDK